MNAVRHLVIYAIVLYGRPCHFYLLVGPLLFFCAFWPYFNVPMEEYPMMRIELQFQFYVGYYSDFMQSSHTYKK
jgi:hypothetical protein